MSGFSALTTQQMIQYYQGLLILQYSLQPNAQAHVAAVVGEILQNQIISQLRDGLDVTSAVGKQLNLLGTFRGINRILFGAIQESVMSLPEYMDTFPGTWLGLFEYADANPTWNFLQYADLNGFPYSLNDNQMRRLIQLAADLDSWDGTLGGLDEIMFENFGTYLNVVDNLNMTIVYQHNHLDTDPDKLWPMVTIAGVLPVSAGVSYTAVEV